MTRTSQQKRREPDPLSAGQSGDVRGLPNTATVDAESVEELVDEGNAFEANAVCGVENAKDPGVSEVATRQVPEGDLPDEYLYENE
jgi:hypothetical protein